MTQKELFCNVIKACAFPQAHGMPDIPQSQYAALHAQLEAHALAALPAGQLRWEEMPQSLRENWQKQLQDQQLRFMQYLIAQEAVLHLFVQAGIPCAVLKGTVSASYYPKPAQRSMGDIDLMVHPDDQARSVQLLKDNGFQEFGYRDEMEQRFRKGPILLELHVGVSADGIHSDAINAMILDHFQGLQEKELYHFAFPCLPESCNGLSMLEHMHRHLRNDLGFRQVIDWMLYVDAYLDDQAWDASMGALLGRCGLETFAVVITAMCQRYFGLRTEDISWPQGADSELCGELFAHISSMGNFGRSLEANHKSAAGMLRDRSLLQVLGSLQEVGCNNWKLCQAHPWLKPFAWLYQIFLYLYRIVTEKYNMSVSLVRKERKRYKKATHMMEKLGFPQPENTGKKVG